MGLPAELRMECYDHSVHLQDLEAVLTPKTKGRLVSNSPLMAVSKQVRIEFEGTLYLHASIKAYVKDFDFTHIVKFLNQLSVAELKVFPKVKLEKDAC
jgi:hypothetical protein